MKKAFKLLAVFLCYSLIGLFLGTLLYSLYENLLNYIAGNKFVFFNFEILKNSFFYISACLILFITSAVTYTRIRYKGGFSQLIVFIIVVVLSWGVFFPLIMKIGGDSIKSPVHIEQKLSEGYFRTVDKEIFYIVDDNENNGISYIHIDETQSGVVTLKNAVSEDELPLKKAAEPFSDVLLADKIKSNIFFSDFINLRLILHKALFAFSKGWTFWLGFLSLGFLLSSVYGLSNIFNWKLINASLVIFSTVLILGFNTSYYNGWLDGFVNLGFWKLPFVTAFGNIVNDPVLVIINLFAGLCFSITGIIRFFICKGKGKKKGDVN